MSATPTTPAPPTYTTHQPDVVQVRITLHPTAIPPARVPLTTRIRRLQNTFTADQQPVVAATTKLGAAVVTSNWVGRTLDVQLPKAVLDEACRTFAQLPEVEKVSVVVNQQPAGQPTS